MPKTKLTLRFALLLFLGGTLAAIYLTGTINTSQKGAPLIVNYKIRGHSMRPFFKDGDVAQVDLDYYKNNTVQRSDMVIIHGQRMNFLIKNIAAIPGDTIGLRRFNNQKDAHLLINGQTFSVHGQPRIFTTAQSRKIQNIISFYNGKVPPESYLALGTSTNSYDSISFGLISQEEISGKVITQLP